MAAKCYYVELKAPYKGKMDYIKFKGVSSPSIKMIQDLHNEGEVKTSQEQWKRTFSNV